jgi:arginine deiminase
MIHVSNEIGTLKKILIHSPDKGIGKFAPSMKDELLYDDIVFLEKMREEYAEYVMVLLWIIDPETAKKIPNYKDTSSFLNTSLPSYHNSSKVLDVEFLLGKILANEKIKNLLVASACAIEELDIATQAVLLRLDHIELAHVLISGVIDEKGVERFLFSPIPNLIFTRDIGIVINDHFLLGKPYEQARLREALLSKYIAYYYLFNETHSEDIFQLSDKVIEILENEFFMLTQEQVEQESVVSIEGGDVMMISPRHLIVGASERTTVTAIDRLINKLFDKNIVDKVTVVKIPRKRSYMHIDTIFTQIKRDLWVYFNPFSLQQVEYQQEKYDFSGHLSMKDIDPAIKITQFFRIEDPQEEYVYSTKKLNTLEDLFADVSKNDFGMKKCDVIYCGGGIFPYNEREQWTDACNYLVLKEGVAIGFDRNIKTIEEFKKKGFQVIKAADFIEQMSKGKHLSEVLIKDTLITLPSAELSRARGGTHCMSMPLLREKI